MKKSLRMRGLKTPDEGLEPSTNGLTDNDNTTLATAHKR
jgi:hypothetical protein